MIHFKVIVVGCGNMANQWISYALTRSDTEIVALVDLVEQQALALAAKHQLSCPFFPDLEEAIRATGANLVFDITIPQAHKQIALTALSQGCHVLGEKPMAMDMDDARQMAEAAKRSQRTYAVMQNRRYVKGIRAYRSFFQKQTFGQVGFVTANFFLGPHFGGFRDRMDSPLLLDMAIHTFDQARFLIGTDPISVYCHEFHPKGSWYQGKAAAACIFEFADGTVFTYNGSWCAEGVPTSWESEWRANGSLGTAIWNGSDAPYCEIIDPAEQSGVFLKTCRRVEAEDVWQGNEGHAGCLDEMFGALLEGRTAETDCSDNIKSVSMMLGAIESARTGNKIDLTFPSPL